MVPLLCLELRLRQSRNELACVKDGVSICRAVELVGRMHHFLGVGRCRVSNQRDMVPKLLRVASGGLGTGVGEQPNENDVTDAMLLQLQIKVRISEPARAPVLFDNYVAVPRGEIRMPIPAPFAARKTMAVHDGTLSRAGMTPGLIVARLPPTMGHDKNLDASAAHRPANGSQVGEKPYLGRHVFDTRPDFSSFRKKVV